MHARITVPAIAALALATAVATSAAAASKQRPRTTTIRTLQLTTAFTPVDVDGNGKPSIGDVLVFRTVHLNPKTRARMGHGDAVCTQITTGRAPVYDCQGSDTFLGGEIREAGSAAGAAGVRWAIIGGSGVYRGARGEYTAHFVDAKLTRARTTFTILGVGE